MMAKLVAAAVLGVASASTLLATGCASEGQKQPYSLTGQQELTADQQRWIDQNSIDEKGHYNTAKHQDAVARVKLANQATPQ